MNDCAWLAKDIRDCCNKAGEPLSEKQFLLIAGYTAALAIALSDSEHSKQNIQPESEKRRAPFPDYKGNPIHDGDTIRRPDGTIGRVRYNTYWYVKWIDVENPQPLKDWLGHKGQAVVVK